MIHATRLTIALLAAVVLLLSAASAHATGFTLTLSGPTVSGTIFLGATPNNDGTFTVTAANGSLTFNGGKLTVTGITAPTACCGALSRFYIGDTGHYWSYDELINPSNSTQLDGLLLTFGGVPYPVAIYYDPTGKYGDGIGYQLGFYVGSGGNDALDPAFTAYPITSLKITPEPPVIAAVEFTQAIQQYQKLADLMASLSSRGEPPVPIISGKPLVMRIYYTPVTDLTTYSLIVTGAASDSELFVMMPNCLPLDQRAEKDPCYATDVYFTPPSGTWSVDIVLNDSQGNQVDHETFTVKSHDTKTLNLAAVQVCLSEFANPFPPDRSSCGVPDALLKQIAFLSSILPTNNVKVTLTGREFDYPPVPGLTDWSATVAFNLATTFYTDADKAADLNGNQFTMYVGIHESSISTSAHEWYNALSPSVGTHGSADLPQVLSFVNGGLDVTQTITAAEIGGALGLPGSNVVPPLSQPPYTPPLCWGIDVPNTLSIGRWPFATNNVQSVNGLEYGFDVPNVTVKDPNRTFDIMTYCSPTWISPYGYVLVAGQLQSGEGIPLPTAGSLHGPQATTTVADQPPLQNALAEGIFLHVSGTIDSGSVTFNPIFTETRNGTADPGTGAYSIVVQGGAGQAFYTRYFNPLGNQTDTFDGTVGTTLQGPVGFSEWIPQTAGVASIAVFDPTGVLLGSVAVAGVAPIVSIAVPAVGFVGTGAQTLSWTIHDADSTSFSSHIFYSTDRGATWTLVGATVIASAIINFDNLPGTANALIRIDVSDGANTGTATSVPFSVPKKSPTSVAIFAPAAGAIRLASKPVYLTGAAYDADDGSLSGQQLQWASNIQGALGSGTPLSATLQPGNHTITLTATDSDGNTISTTTSVTVVAGPPIVTLTTNSLTANCVSATIAAGSGNQGAPLSSVKYSLDGGATYTSIPLTQLPYSFVIPGSSAVSLLASATDLSKQIAAQSMRVSLSRSCITGVPSLSGGSSQATPVGSAFSIPLSTLVSDNNGNPVPSVAVNFTAPATGPSATLSPATATSNSSGIASTTATANSTNGNYKVLASVPGFSTTVQFSLTNTDFSFALDNSAMTVTHGSTGTATITVAPLNGFNSAVTLACTGLPAGATCSFSPATVTPSGSPVTSMLTITTADNARTAIAALRWALPGGGFALAFCLIGPGMRRHRKFFGPLCLVFLVAVLSSTVGCASFSPFTSTVTVTATSGTLQHTGNISLSVK